MNRLFSLNNQLGFLIMAMLIATALPQNLAAAPRADTAVSTGKFQWENAIIYIEITSKVYNYIQPWERSEKKVSKSGVVVEGRQILTTAEGLADQTLIRLKKQGNGLFSLGRVAWVDYQANIASITTDEKDFWTGLQPAKLAEPVPVTGPVRILSWSDDQLENRQGEIQRMTVVNSALSFVSVPSLRIDSNIQGAGYGEAVTAGDKLIGLVDAQGGNVVSAVPTSFIAPILRAQMAKTYTGLGYFDFTWDAAGNPLNLDYLKLPGPARGVIVKETGMKPGLVSQIHPRDVILQIDGFDIDAEGNYRDPEYRKLCLENLSSRGKWAGMECKFKLWRDGKELNLVYKLPKAEYADALIPSQSFDQAPEYVLAGGFVFVPLTEAYLRSWGTNWRQRAPFRLTYYDTGKVTAERPQRVVLTQVLPDPSNIGYETMRNLVVDEINGLKIRQIADVVTALKSPVDGFNIFKFEAGESVRQAVLDASNFDETNDKIMAHYHIPTDQVLNSPVALK